MKNLAIVTFVYNESKQLPRWLRHYSKHVESDSDLYIVDHGSDDGSLDHAPIAVNKIRLTREDGSERLQAWRAQFIANLTNKLLQEYRAVIYTDCDEYLVVDPLVSERLCDYINMPNVATNAIGFDVLHDFDKEPPLDSWPISSIRKNYQFVAAMCKPAIVLSGHNIVWGSGFHVSNMIPKFGDLYLFHARYADITEGLDRLKITREIYNPQLDKAHTNHHKLDDATYINWVLSWLKFKKNFSAITSNSDPINNFLKEFKFSMGELGLYNYDYSYRSNELFEVPDRFLGKF